ncbi:head fiber protein [Enterobacter kobei]
MAATTTTAGIVKKMASQADSTATDVAGLVADFNALLAKARTAGLM